MPPPATSTSNKPRSRTLAAIDSIKIELDERLKDLESIGKRDEAQRLHQRTMFDLEMITREPLKIPVFTAKYWATFDDPRSPLPGHDLAKMLELVKKSPPKVPVPHTAGLSPEAALKLEDDNNRESLVWARKNLDL